MTIPTAGTMNQSEGYSCHDEGFVHEIQPDGSCAHCPQTFDSDGDVTVDGVTR